MVQSNAPFQRLFAEVLSKAKRHNKDGITIDQLCGENEAPALLKAMNDANDGKGTIDFVDSVLPGVAAQIDNEDCSIRYFISAVADGEAEAEDGQKKNAPFYMQLR